MEYDRLRTETINAGFGASAGVYFHLNGIEPVSAIALAMGAFVLFWLVLAASKGPIERRLAQWKEQQ